MGPSPCFSSQPTAASKSPTMSSLPPMPKLTRLSKARRTNSEHKNPSQESYMLLNAVLSRRAVIRKEKAEHVGNHHGGQSIPIQNSEQQMRPLNLFSEPFLSTKTNVQENAQPSRPQCSLAQQIPTTIPQGLPSMSPGRIFPTGQGDMHLNSEPNQSHMIPPRYIEVDQSKKQTMPPRQHQMYLEMKPNNRQIIQPGHHHMQANLPQYQHMNLEMNLEERQVLQPKYQQMNLNMNPTQMQLPHPKQHHLHLEIDPSHKEGIPRRQHLEVNPNQRQASPPKNPHGELETAPLQRQWIMKSQDCTHLGMNLNHRQTILPKQQQIPLELETNLRQIAPPSYQHMQTELDSNQRQAIHPRHQHMQINQKQAVLPRYEHVQTELNPFQKQVAPPKHQHMHMNLDPNQRHVPPRHQHMQMNLDRNQRQVPPRHQHMQTDLDSNLRQAAPPRHQYMQTDLCSNQRQAVPPTHQYMQIELDPNQRQVIPPRYQYMQTDLDLNQRQVVPPRNQHMQAELDSNQRQAVPPIHQHMQTVPNSNQRQAVPPIHQHMQTVPNSNQRQAVPPIHQHMQTVPNSNQRQAVPPIHHMQTVPNSNQRQAVPPIHQHMQTVPNSNQSQAVPPIHQHMQTVPNSNQRQAVPPIHQHMQTVPNSNQRQAVPLIHHHMQTVPNSIQRQAGPLKQHMQTELDSYKIQAVPARQTGVQRDTQTDSNLSQSHITQVIPQMPNCQKHNLMLKYLDHYISRKNEEINHQVIRQPDLNLQQNLKELLIKFKELLKNELKHNKKLKKEHLIYFHKLQKFLQSKCIISTQPESQNNDQNPIQTESTIPHSQDHGGRNQKYEITNIACQSQYPVQLPVETKALESNPDPKCYDINDIHSEDHIFVQKLDKDIDELNKEESISQPFDQSSNEEDSEIELKSEIDNVSSFISTIKGHSDQDQVRSIEEHTLLSAGSFLQLLKSSVLDDNPIEPMKEKENFREKPKTGILVKFSDLLEDEEEIEYKFCPKNEKIHDKNTPTQISISANKRILDSPDLKGSASTPFQTSADRLRLMQSCEESEDLSMTETKPFYVTNPPPDEQQTGENVSNPATDDMASTDYELIQYENARRHVTDQTTCNVNASGLHASIGRKQTYTDSYIIAELKKLIDLMFLPPTNTFPDVSKSPTNSNIISSDTAECSSMEISSSPICLPTDSSSYNQATDFKLSIPITPVEVPISQKPDLLAQQSLVNIRASSISQSSLYVDFDTNATKAPSPSLQVTGSSEIHPSVDMPSNSHDPISPESPLEPPALLEAKELISVPVDSLFQVPVSSKSPVKVPLTSDFPARDFVPSKSPIHYSVSSESSTQDPVSLESFAQDLMPSESPTQIPILSDSPAQHTVPSESHVQDPVLSESPIEDPVSSQSPIQDPVSSESPIQDFVLPESPIQDPLASESHMQEIIPLLPPVHKHTQSVTHLRNSPSPEIISIDDSSSSTSTVESSEPSTPLGILPFLHQEPTAPSKSETLIPPPPRLPTSDLPKSDLRPLISPIVSPQPPKRLENQAKQIQLDSNIKCLSCFKIANSSEASNHMFFGQLQCMSCNYVINTCEEFRNDSESVTGGCLHKLKTWNISPIDFLIYRLRMLIISQTNNNNVSFPKIVTAMDEYVQSLNPLQDLETYKSAIKKCLFYTTKMKRNIEREEKRKQKLEFRMSKKQKVT